MQGTHTIYSWYFPIFLKRPEKGYELKKCLVKLPFLTALFFRYPLTLPLIFPLKTTVIFYETKMICYHVRRNAYPQRSPDEPL